LKPKTEYEQAFSQSWVGPKGFNEIRPEFSFHIRFCKGIFFDSREKSTSPVYLRRERKGCRSTSDNDADSEPDPGGHGYLDFQRTSAHPEMPDRHKQDRRLTCLRRSAAGRRRDWAKRPFPDGN
jgi:hypothetical protein